MSSLSPRPRRGRSIGDERLLACHCYKPSTGVGQHVAPMRLEPFAVPMVSLILGTRAFDPVRVGDLFNNEHGLAHDSGLPDFCHCTKVASKSKELRKRRFGMMDGDTEFVSMSVDFKTGPRDGFRITYATDDNRLSCPSGSGAQPVEVICTDSPDGPCVAWIVTGRSACLLDLKTEEPMGGVEADFSLDVLVQ